MDYIQRLLHTCNEICSPVIQRLCTSMISYAATIPSRYVLWLPRAIGGRVCVAAWRQADCGWRFCGYMYIAATRKNVPSHSTTPGAGMQRG